MEQEKHRRDILGVILRANPEMMKNARPILDHPRLQQFEQHLESLLSVLRVLLKVDYDQCSRQSGTRLSRRQSSLSRHSDSSYGRNSPRSMSLCDDELLSEADGVYLPTPTLSQRTRAANHGSLRRWIVGDVAVPSNYESRLSCLFLHPQAPVRRYWSMLNIFSLIYFIVVLPLRVAFDRKHSINIALECVLDSVFAIEMIVKFLTIFIANRQTDQYVYSFRRIAWRYVQRWFLLDLMSLLPISTIVATLLPGSSGPLRFAKVTEMSRLLRLCHLSSYTKQAIPSLSGRKLRLLQFAMVLAIGAHVTACLWIFLASFDFGSTESWLETYDISLVTELDIVRAPMRRFVNRLIFAFFVQYMTAFYFASMTMTSVGFGDVYPVTKLEKIFTIFLMAFSVTGSASSTNETPSSQR
jgi:hypothetical protein